VVARVGRKPRCRLGCDLRRIRCALSALAHLRPRQFRLSTSPAIGRARTERSRRRRDDGRRAPKPPRVRTGTPRATLLSHERARLSPRSQLRRGRSDGTTTEPQAPKKRLLEVPRRLWSWTEAAIRRT
jgi:hypothetical protein